MDRAKVIAEIVELQRRLNRFMRRDSIDFWMNISLTVPQLKSLFFIVNKGSTSPRRLAAALKVTPSNVTGIIDRLVEQGLVSRRESPEDRRVLLLQATQKGEGIIGSLRERRTSYLSRTLTLLTARELASLSRGLSALVRAARVSEGKGKHEHN